MRIQLPVTLLLLVIVTTAIAQDGPRYSHTGPTMIKGVRVIDGLGGDAIENQDIVLIDGKIASLGPTGTNEAPKNEHLRHAQGQTRFPARQASRPGFTEADEIAMLFISPSKNLVVAYFATRIKYDTFKFAPAIRKSFR